jgi:hypothetical protein
VTNDPLAYLRDALDKAEAVGRAASGGTVIGEPGRWEPSPAGDEWEASRTDVGEDELLVALRPGLPRPPDVMSGLWGAVVSAAPDESDRDAWSPLPQFQHAALHDPAAVLRRIAADRKLIALHHPVIDRTGWRHGDYGDVRPACAECGSQDTATAWPCDTIRFLAEGWGWTAETT